MDPNKKIFENILDAGEAGLERMINEKRSEDQHLEFKLVTNQNGPIDNEDRRNFARSTGGFANSEGGVIVWGVKCRKGEDTLDVATALVPIGKVKQFKVALDEYGPQVLIPFPEIQNVVIPSASEGTGYLVTYVPSWDGSPIRSTMKNHGCDFFVRSGNQFQTMNYGALADRFGRRPLPRLRVAGALNLQDNGHDFRLSIINTGRGVAKLIAVTIPNIPDWPQQIDGWHHASGVGNSEQPFSYAGTCYEAPTGLYIHSNTSKEFFWALKITDEFVSAVQSGIEIPYDVVCDGYSHSGVLIARQDADDVRRWLLLEK